MIMVGLLLARILCSSKRIALILAGREAKFCGESAAIDVLRKVNGTSLAELICIAS